MKPEGINIYPAGRINLQILKSKKIAILGYGSQGKAQAFNLRDSGFTPIIGLPEKSKSRKQAIRDKFKVMLPSEAVGRADIIAVLAPDQVQGDLFSKQIKDSIYPGQTFIFAHALSVHFGLVKQPKGVDFVLVAPHAPGIRMREQFEQGKSVSAFIGKTEKSSGVSLRIAAAYARAVGCNQKALIVTSFANEAVGDIFGEQAVLCGGLAGLIQAGFETLVKRGIPPPNAYLECIYQLDLIVDLIKRYGIGGMYDRISYTAHYGGKKAENKIINASSKRAMSKLLKDIEGGKFVRDFIKDSNKKAGRSSPVKVDKYRKQVDNLARYFDSISGK
jgi:ketol-acid reductoisomerase